MGVFNSKNVKSSVISKLSEITHFHHISEDGGVYDYFTPLTEEQLKALNLKNE